MKNPILICSAVLLSFSAWGQTNAPAAAPQAAAEQTFLSIKEMLAVGPSPLKLHALSMITQGKGDGNLDESYLPGFKVCAEDPDELVRSITARLLGQHFIEGRETPNPEAVALLMELASDKATFVRYNAIYYGLSFIEDKSPAIIQRLVEVASTERDSLLSDCVIQSLANCPEQAGKILDEKLKTDDALAYFEIYEKLTGRKPPATDRLLDMPSTRPVMFVFTGAGDDNDTFRADLEKELKALGLRNPELFDTGADNTYAVMLKTYVTRDRVAVEEAFADHARFPMPQIWWLTPELEVQFDGMRNK